MNEHVAQWLAIAGLLASASGLTMLLRWARAEPTHSLTWAGWSMLGGFAAGLLLGPTVLGRVMPEQYEHWFSGGVEQRIERDRLVRSALADALAAEHGGFDAQQVTAMRDEHDAAIYAAAESWRQAQWQDQRALRMTAMTAIGVLLLLSGAQAIKHRDRRQGILAPMSIGLWAAALPGGVAYLAAYAWWGLTAIQSAMLASAMAIGPWALSPIDQNAADDAELGGAHMIQTAGRLASVLAIAVAAVAAWAALPPLGSDGLMLTLPMLCLPLGWMFGARLPRFDWLVELVVLPAVTALLAVKVDVIEHFRVWPLIVILLLCDDGRWLGAFIGAMLPGGRRGLRTTRLVMGAMSAGPTQLGLAALAVHAWLMPETMLLPIVLGAMLIEFTAPTRRAMADQLAAMEADLDESES